MILLPLTRPVYASIDPVDMRRSFDVLVTWSRERLGLDALRSAVVLFFNRDLTRCKLLFHDGSGLVIVYKRLDRGRFEIPLPLRPGDQSVEIALGELPLILEGKIRQALSKS